MKKGFLLCFFLIYYLASTGQYWQQKVDFKIEVSLNDKEHTLDAFEKINYTNNSPDTLHFIWFHLWPNAYKNDRTAFSEQMLENGSTAFYFSDKKDRGYINRLDFKVGSSTAKTEDHPLYSDIIKVLLPAPLLPGGQIIITTPFHVQLPALFSRNGYKNGLFQVTQWYPKPAVYDTQGWHPMPYLEQGEFYSEFGDYEVSIILPGDFIVAATGQLQNEDALLLLKNNKRSEKDIISQKNINKSNAANKLKTVVRKPETTALKTWNYKQNSVHDFAWFANKGFSTAYDTCLLASGKVIDLFSFYIPEKNTAWKEVIPGIKEAVRTRSNWISDYPYNVLNVVEGGDKKAGGMEYPTIVVASGISDKKNLDETIAHEIGHSWFYSAVASNERQHPWMDEGINTFYDYRYHYYKWGNKGTLKLGRQTVRYKDVARLLYQSLAAEKKDQPIETPADQFSAINYNLIGYDKAALWLESLQDSAGMQTFDLAMKTYYQRWSFKHPTPEDFKTVFQSIAGEKILPQFNALQQRGVLPEKGLKQFRIASPLNPPSIKKFIEHPAKNLLLLSPVIGYNNYDKLMAGLMATNFKLPQNKLGYLLMPLYAPHNSQLNGLGKISYHWHPDGAFQKITIGLSGSRFSTKESRDTLGQSIFQHFYKTVPSIAFIFKQPDRSTVENKLEWKTFFIGEKDFSKFVVKSTDGLFYVDSIATTNRYINQLTFIKNNYRALYPYDYSLQWQQAKEFYRINFTADYFFNYAKGGGLSVRVFAAKFGYLNSGNKLYASRYLPKLLGTTGEEDYTYSDYFIGRTASYANAANEVVANKGLGAQQIMIRDGGFKLRADQFDFLQGRSENWVAALNLSTTLPQKLFPFKLPLKIFLDVGTYAEAWDKDEEGNRLRYVGGLQLSLLKNMINVYAPLVYSAAYRDNLKTFPELNTFTKRLTFSIDVHRFNLRRLAGKELPF